MATLLSVATGNFTSSSTWAVCDSTSELDSNNTQTMVSTGNTDSSTFTPGAITVDGIAIKLFSRAASPSGTFTVKLRNSTDSTDVTSIAVNVSDLPANTDTTNSFHNGWIFFKFGSSQTLISGKAYIVRLTTSASSQVVVHSNSGNLSRQLRTTTTAAPGSGDKLIIGGEWTAASTFNAITVTMDNTASTTFGSTSFNESLTVGQNGTLAFGSSSSTNYLLKVAGYVYVATGGTLNMGTAGTPIPSSSTAILDFAGASAVDSGLRLAGGTLVTYGASKTSVTTVTSTANASQAVVNVASVTGWGANDEIVLTATERNNGQFELRTISSIATLAVTVSSNFSYKHSGSSVASAPNAVRGHVGMLTYNVKIRGGSNSLRAFIHVTTNGSCTMRYTETKWLGSQFSGGKQGITWATATTVDIQYCSVAVSSWVGNSAASYTTGWTFSRNVVYKMDTSAIRVDDTTSSVAWTMDGNLQIDSSGNYGYQLRALNGATFTNNIGNGNTSGLAFNVSAFNGSRAISTCTYSGNDFNNNGTAGVEVISSGSGIMPLLTMSGGALWRNVVGIYINSSNSYAWTVDGTAIFGNTTAGIQVNYFTTGCVVRNAIFDGEASFAQGRGIYAGTNCQITELMFENCQFGQTVGHGSNDAGWNNTPLIRWTFLNCKFGSSPFQTMGGSATLNAPYPGSIIACQKYGQTAGDHRTFQVFGKTKTDAVIYKTASPSERCIPSESNSLFKLRSGSKLQTASSGGTLTVSVWVRKSVSTDSGGANYNGSQLRLMMRRNPAVGLNSDVVLATGSAALGTWEQLTATTSSTSGDSGVLEFYVDGDGTAGWFNVDDWTIS